MSIGISCHDGIVGTMMITLFFDCMMDVVFPSCFVSTSVLNMWEMGPDEDDLH